MTPVAALLQRARQLDGERQRLGEPGADFLETRARAVGLHRQNGAPLFDDGEFVNQSLELRDEVGGDKHRAIFRIARLVGADDRLDEFAADDGVQPGSRLVQHEQFRLRRNGADQGQLRFLAFGQVGGFFGRVQIEAMQQAGFDLAVPAGPERRQVIERLAHGHPGIESHGIGHVAKAGLDGDFVLARVQAKDAHRPRRGLEEVEQAFDGGGFARAVAAEEAVAAAWAHGQAQAVDRIQFAEAPGEVREFNSEGVHNCGLRVADFMEF